MISELFGFLSAVDVTGKGEKRKISLKANLNRNRIRSISAFSSNSIFYFPCIVSDQCMPEEVSMATSMLEKSYASFVVACISLMPFHRIRADDQASIEEYLSQFHQNINMKGGTGSAMNKIFSTIDSLDLDESASDIDDAEAEKRVGEWLLECWHKSLDENTDFVKLISTDVSLNEMFNESAIDDKIRVIQERYHAVQDELNNWGFLGEATEEMFDSDDDDDGALTEGALKTAIDNIKFSLESVSENKIMSCQSLTKLRSLEAKLLKLKGKYTRYLNRYKKKWKENKKNGTKSKLAIRFNNLSINSPKAFMKQYGEYIKVINRRLKAVEKRRAELRKRKGLADEAAIPDMLTSLDFDTLDYCDRTITESLNAPDDEIFTILDEDAEADLLKRLKGVQDYAQTVTDNLTIAYRDRDNAVALARIDQQRADSAQRTAQQLRAQNQNLTNRIGEKGEEIRVLQKKARDAEKAYNEARKKWQTASADQRAEYKDKMRQYEDKIKDLEKMIKEAEKVKGGGRTASSSDDREGFDIVYNKNRPSGGINMAQATNRAKFTTFSKEVFTDMDMKKANEAIPTFTHANIGFVIDETEEVVTRDVLLGIKTYVHRAPSAELINDLYNCIINKRKFLKFVKFITGEERSLADLLFGFKELRTDALDAKNGAGEWRSAFKRRRRWAKMSIPYLTKEYTPNGSIVMTMNEVEFIRSQYGIDIMNPDHVRMIMDADFLLGFVILDQANEMVYVTYDGHGYGFQQYTYAMLERQQVASDRMMRELYRSFSR